MPRCWNLWLLFNLYIKNPLSHLIKYVPLDWSSTNLWTSFRKFVIDALTSVQKACKNNKGTWVNSNNTKKNLVEIREEHPLLFPVWWCGCSFCSDGARWPVGWWNPHCGSTPAPPVGRSRDTQLVKALFLSHGGGVVLVIYSLWSWGAQAICVTTINSTMYDNSKYGQMRSRSIRDRFLFPVNKSWILVFIPSKMLMFSSALVF